MTRTDALPTAPSNNGRENRRTADAHTAHPSARPRAWTARTAGAAAATGAAALLVVVALRPLQPAAAQIKETRTRPPAQPAGQTDVPVKQVVLFSSGVGYFEHFGTVKGDGTAELRFKTDQINDVLKSLVLQDLDKGQVGTVTYPSQEPLTKTLKSFQVDITTNPPLADLLNELRGAKITLTLAEGTGQRHHRRRRETPARRGGPARRRRRARSSRPGC